MKNFIYYKFLIFYLITIPAIARQENLAPLSGALPPSFVKQADQLGTIEGSVNLFTGNVEFLLPLVSLSGKGGLDVSVSISYNSNVHRQVNTWNREAPTGIMGLGWSGDYPEIVVDNKMTGTREDDTYYIVDGGTTYELLYSGGSGSEKNYTCKNYQFWSIAYYPETEKWKIIKEDGTAFVYGDKDNGRSTVQWIVTWGNWIGSSNVTTSSMQKQQALVWNLSEMVNIWNDKVLFTYTNSNQKVGGTAGKEHTEASYLSQITDTYGQTVNFSYGNKSSNEYAEPHTENGTNAIDAYQERYETKYLDKIETKESDGTLINRVQFGYGSLSSGNKIKRLLTTITQYNEDNNALPGYSFTYVNSASENYGALKSIQTPTKSMINYEYASNTITNAIRKKQITTINGYAEPKVWIGPDYVVVTRRQLNSSGEHTSSKRNVIVQVFTWDGEWIEWNHSSTQVLYNVQIVDNGGNQASSLTDETYDYQDFRLTLQKDFFAILENGLAGSTSDYYHNLIIYRRDNKTRNVWNKHTASVYLYPNWKGRETDLVSGENFLAIAGIKSSIYAYSWNGSSWTSQTITRPESTHNHMVAGHNYIISHKRGSPDVINFHFLKEDGTWLTKTASSMSDTSTGDESYWYPAASFAVVIADDNSEYIYSWDEEYTMLTPVNTGIGIPDDLAYVDIVNNSMVGIVKMKSTVQGYGLRYNGQTWAVTAAMDYSGVDINTRNSQSYGEDFIIRPRQTSGTGYIGLKYFNPNNNTWYDADYLTGNRFLSIAGYNYFVYIDGSNTTSAKLVTRSPSGSFVTDATLINGFNASDKQFGWQAGYNFVVKNLYAADEASFTDAAQSIKFENGTIDPNAITISSGTYLEDCGLRELGYSDASRTLVSGNTIVGFMDTFNQFDAQQLTLFKFIDGNSTGALTSFSVNKVSVDNGTSINYNYIDYATSTATWDPSGNVSQYNKVSIYPGAQWVDNTNGRTEYYFFNGISSTSAGNFPSVSVSYDDYQKLIHGMSYLIRVYTSSGSVVSEKIMAPSFYYKEISATSAAKDRCWYVRPYIVWETHDGMLAKSTVSINTSNGQLSQKQLSPNNGSVAIVELYTYLGDVNTTAVGQNLLTPVVQVRRMINGTVTEAFATRYKQVYKTVETGETNGIPYSIMKPVFTEYDTYLWKHSGSSTFTEWDVTLSPGTNWLKLKSIESRTASGYPKEIWNSGDRIQAKFYSSNEKYLYAEVENTEPDRTVYYNGFEDETANISASAKTGQKSSVTSLTLTANFDGGYAYRLSYWKKPVTSGAWELITETITSDHTIGGTGFLIDEVRLHPVRARMTTYAYNAFGNRISICDPNNNVIKYEYDAFQRLVLKRDGYDNILEQYQYFVKK